jgi:PIF1-like helicase
LNIHLANAGFQASDQKPYVDIISDDKVVEKGIQLIEDICTQFSLNRKQKLAFSIIALQSFHPSRHGKQLRMAVLGEGGTGKSLLICAVRQWYASLGRSDEIVITATTGAAADNIGSSTIHSAAAIPVKGQRIFNKKREMEVLWKTRK